MDNSEARKLKQSVDNLHQELRRIRILMENRFGVAPEQPPTEEPVIDDPVSRLEPYI